MFDRNSSYSNEITFKDNHFQCIHIPYKLKLELVAALGQHCITKTAKRRK